MLNVKLMLKIWSDNIAPIFFLPSRDKRVVLSPFSIKGHLECLIVITSLKKPAIGLSRGLLIFWNPNFLKGLH